MIAIRRLFKKILYVITGVQQRWGNHAISAYSAQMAYFFLLSIFPFLIFLLAVLGKMEITYTIVNTAALELVPSEAMVAVEGFVKNLLKANLETLVPISLLTSLWTASKAFSALECALNTAYEVEKRRSYIRGRGVGLIMTVALSAMIIVALTLPSMGFEFTTAISQYVQVSPSLISFLNNGRWYLILSIFILVLFSLYIWLPNIQLKVRDILPGTCFAIFGWWALSVSFSVLVQQVSSFSFIYGSLGAVVTLMIWLYFIGLILMIGGEINALLSEYKAVNSKESRS